MQYGATLDKLRHARHFVHLEAREALPATTQQLERGIHGGTRQQQLVVEYLLLGGEGALGGGERRGGELVSSKVL